MLVGFLSAISLVNGYANRFMTTIIYRALTRRIRTTSCATDDLAVSTSPSKWPGVDSIVALIARQVDEEMPNLRLLLLECFISITLSLFCYSFAVYDSRWLYRLMAHETNAKNFGLLFGGGGEKRLRSAPMRPPRKLIVILA